MRAAPTNVRRGASGEMRCAAATGCRNMGGREMGAATTAGMPAASRVPTTATSGMPAAFRCDRAANHAHRKTDGSYGY
jgi:hypothetical protein